MGMKHNVALPNNHFNKSNKKYKMSFNAAAQKLRRATLRKKKAMNVFPRPARQLQPIANCQSQRYNHKIKLAKGFSLLEIEKAGLKESEARALRIRVDRRRITKSEESLNRNVQRIKDYHSKLTFYKNTKEVKEAGVKQFMGKILFDKPKSIAKVISKSDIE